MSWLSDFLHQVAPQQGWGAAFVTAGLGAFAGGLVASRAFTKRAAIACQTAYQSTTAFRPPSLLTGRAPKTQIRPDVPIIIERLQDEPDLALQETRA